MGTRRSPLFRLLWRGRRVLERGMRALTYVAAGTLSREEMWRASLPRWERFNASDDAATGLFEWEERLFDAWLRPGDRILLVGCGTGRDLLPLLRRGHEVTGLDPAERALRVAAARLARHGLGAPLHCGAAESTDVRGPFDAVVLSWYCYGYIVGADARHAALARQRAALAPGGRILLSYLADDGVAPGTLRLRAMRLGARLGGGWRPEPGDVVWADDAGHVHYEHVFGAEEIEAEARAAGCVALEHERAGERGLLVLTAL
jgi:SAM-dependent methyltransferase